MISSFRHLEIIKPPLDVLLQEITQVLLMSSIMQKEMKLLAGSSNLQSQTSSGFSEKSLRVRSQREGGDEGGGGLTQQR